MDTVEKKENIKLEYNNVDDNAGWKAIAKLMLNSFWGKIWHPGFICIYSVY